MIASLTVMDERSARHLLQRSAIERAIPDWTQVQTLRDLQRRYRNTTDTAVAALPPAYRRAVVNRLHVLLAAAQLMPGPAS